MTWEDLERRTEAVLDSFAMTNNGEDEAEPLCQALAGEMGLEHEDVHSLAHALTMVAVKKGGRQGADLALFGFAFGRKWGLIEAADMIATTGDDLNG